MRKRIFSIFLAVAMIFCIIPLSAYADEHQHTFENKHGYDLSNLPEGYSIPCKIYESPCSSECGYSLYSWDVFGLSGQFVDKTGTSGLVVYQHYREWFEKIYGRNATASKYQTGGGSAGTGGVGRNPSGYDDNNGALIGSSGTQRVRATFKFFVSTDSNGQPIESFSTGNSYIYATGTPGQVIITSTDSSKYGISFGGGYFPVTQEPGYYTLPEGTEVYNFQSYQGNTSYPSTPRVSTTLSGYGPSNGYRTLYISPTDTYTYFFYCSDFKNENKFSVGYSTTNSSNSISFHSGTNGRKVIHAPHDIYLEYTPISSGSGVKSYTQYNINNNTWNGNIYVDNSTNLTYIYPQYTTINENNETVTNISNNPIIYNNTTNQYYTYDTVTNNYYYITYEAPSPEPSETPTPTPAPGGDTGDTSSLLDVLIEIKDNIIQGFADIKATLVQGWADLSANFTLAIENLNLNITNIFNKKFPDQSTPETAQPSPSPSPSPEPVDPILPETQNLIIPKMNSNTFTDEHGTWVASGSSKYSDVFDFFHAFDRSTSDFWETNVSPSYLKIEIPDPENYYIDGYIMRISKFDNRYPKDWTLQGSDDGETWDDLDTQAGQNLSDKAEHKYTLTLRKAYKYYRVNMSNYASSMCSLSHFNLLGYDVKDVVTPTPSPSPTPDPGETPTPTPAPTDKPSNGNTNNFWNFVFPGGNDDGTENGHKGILWALISLLIAVVTFVLGLGSAYSYVFPFLPAGLVTTIHICVLVLLLFAIIKFVRSFL